MAEGRLTEAATILEKAIPDDRAHDLQDAAEFKSSLLAEVRLRQGDRAGALAAAAKVTKDRQRLFTAAMVQLASGDDKHALATAAKLANDITPEPRALAKLLEAEAQRLRGSPQLAIIKIQEALRITDVWSGHLLLARAALDAGHFADAYTEIKVCLARRGEVVLGFDDTPTVRYLPALTYYLARAQEAIGSADAAGSYKAFLAMHVGSEHDPLVDDARRRAGP